MYITLNICYIFEMKYEPLNTQVNAAVVMEQESLLLKTMQEEY